MAQTLTIFSAVNLPDATNGPVGEGFTCTGMTTASTGGWWVMHYGRTDPLDETISSNIVHLSADFSTNLGEIDLSAFTSNDMQGITRDTTDNSLWLAINGSTVRRYNEAGVMQSENFSVTGVNGICYDPDNDILYTLTVSGVFRSYSPNTLTKIADLASISPGGNCDHLAMVNGKVWASDGDNGFDGKIWEYTPGTDSWEHIYTLTGADSIEGIAVDGYTLYVANDGYFHNGNPKKNRILVYHLPGWTPSGPTAPTFSVTNHITPA